MIPKTWIKILTDELRKTGHSKEIAKCRANTFYQDLMNYINDQKSGETVFWWIDDNENEENLYSLECLISIIHHRDQLLESDLVHANHRSQRLDPCGKIPLFEPWYDIFYI